MVICMHMHGICGMRMLKRTSLGRPEWAVERLGTAAADAAARPRSAGVGPLPLASMAASAGPTVRVGVGA